MTKTPRIAILGAGPAGLTTAVLLHNAQIPFTLFELRQKPTTAELSTPSGMLDLHEESALAALKECNLYEEFLTLTGECSEAQKDEGEMSERPEISRHALTGLLCGNIPSERIRWGWKVLSVKKVGDGTEVEVDFGTRGKEIFDLVIGADGAWSQVRGLLTDVKPYYTGTQSITMTVRHISTKYPHLAEFVGSGSFSALGMRHGVMSQRGPMDSARIYIFFSTGDEDFAGTAGVAGRTAADAKDRLLGDDALLGLWGAAIKELVSVACEEDTADSGAAVDVRPLYMLPIGTSWEHNASATLIGDAAHLMCPWAGEGVNVAMWDSLLLARAIIKAYEAGGQGLATFRDVLDPLIKGFEVDMVARAKEKAEETYSNGKMMFGEDGAAAFRDFFLNVQG